MTAPAPLTGFADDMGGGNAALVLRLRKMAVLIADEDAPPITTIVNATGTALSIPGQYRKVGYLGKDDGASLAPAIETSDSTAYGQSQPINRYVDSTSFTAGFTMKETSKTVLEAYNAVDLSAVRANKDTYEVSFDIPDQPEVRNPRLLIIGQHRDGADAIFVAQFLPRATIDDIGEQTMSDTEDYVYPVTYTALVDATLGTSRRPFFAGPGMKKLGDTPMGFELAA